MMRTWIAASLMLVACTSSATTPPDGDDDETGPGTGDPTALTEPAGPGWTTVGVGVEYRRVTTGNAILIAYGGYSAHLSYSAAWATELVDQKLGGVDVGQIYAVQGPADPGYDGREIGNSKLRRHLKTIDDGHSPIYIVAHSSGSYVAHELLGQMERAGETGALSRIGYADLDGGGSGLDDTIIGDLRKVTFVYAHDPSLSSGYSQNHTSAISLGQAYAPKAQTFDVVVPNTGCDDGAGWCLHDVVITHRPHHAWSYDLADDYTDFQDRPCSIEYLDTLIGQ